MADEFSKLSKSQKISVKDLLVKWEDGSLQHDDIIPHDWKTPAIEALKQGDLTGIQKAVAPSVQYGVAEIALTSRSDAVRLQASQLLLSQVGQGPVQRVEQSISFDKMSRDQLVSVVRSRMERLAILDPSLDLGKLFPIKEDAIEVEFSVANDGTES